MFFTLMKLTLIKLFLRFFKKTFSLKFSIFYSSPVLCPTSKFEIALSCIFDIILKLTIIDISIFIIVDSTTMLFILSKAAFVIISVLILDLASTLKLTIVKVSYILVYLFVVTHFLEDSFSVFKPVAKLSLV